MTARDPMPAILRGLRFAASNFPFLSDAQLLQRAKWVAEDFQAVGLRYWLAGQKVPRPDGAGFLPYAFYQLVGSQCDVDHAVSGDRRHTSMSGGGLDRECLLYYSKVSEWAHTHIPQLWPDGLRTELRDPNSHLDTVCEAWWLSRVVGGDFSTVEHGVPVDPALPAGKNFDWQVRLPGAGVTLNLEVKRRPGDLGRSIDVPRLKWKSVFHEVDKFSPPAPPDVLNVGCIRLFAPISREVHAAARQWLEVTPQVSALAFFAPCPRKDDSFAVITQPGLDYVRLLFAPPDLEDHTYIAPFWFAGDTGGAAGP